MEREVLFTGIGGQGVQIASKALAMAAIGEGRQVLLVPRYGGGMRGGMTNAELTVGDGPLRALPVASSAWSAYVMDPSYWSTIEPNLRPGAVIVVNSSLFDVAVDVEGPRVFEVPATSMASELGSAMGARVRAARCLRGTHRNRRPGAGDRRHAPTRPPLPDPARGRQRARHSSRGGGGARDGRTGMGRRHRGGAMSRRADDTVAAP